MSEIVERVARALADDEVEGWEYETVPDFWKAKARAAIAAMREPTEMMVYNSPFIKHQSLTIWQAMIDCALEEK